MKRLVLKLTNNRIITSTKGNLDQLNTKLGWIFLERGITIGYVEEIRELVGHRPIILVGTVIVIIDQNGHILLQQRTFPKGVWGLPGGLMELGESTEDVGRREVKEETGLTVGELHLINIYSGSRYFTRAQNGDEFYSVTAAYWTKDYKGTLEYDEESLALEFFPPKELPEQMIGSHREIIEDYRKNLSDIEKGNQ